MGLVAFHVDRIDVQIVPKFVLFGGSERDETGPVDSSVSTDGERSLPVSLGQVVAVSIAATVFAIAAVRLKEIVDAKLDLHC